MTYLLDTCPKLDSLLEGVEKDVPESLELLVRKIVTPKKCKNIDTRATAILHAVISTTGHSNQQFKLYLAHYCIRSLDVPS